MVDRSRLARGTKLVPGQITTPLSTIGNAMNTSGVAVDTYAAPLSTFRVNLHIPYIASDYRSEYIDTVPEPDVTHEVAIPYGVPFTLPPLQEFFDTDVDSGSVTAPEIDEDTPFYTLEEVSFSFDQRGEPGAIADHFYDENATPGEGSRDLNGNSINKGKVEYEKAAGLEVTISILEKSQHVFDSGNILPDREVFTATITADGLTGRVLRFNPFIVTDLNKTLSPYKTYIFTVFCPALLDPEGEDAAGAAATLRRTLALVSVQASMKISTKMVDRDKYVASTSEIQNIPKYTGNTVHDGAKQTRTSAGIGVAISSPAVNTVIHADQDGTGVNRNMNEIDKVYREKLKGGYRVFGEPHGSEELKEDAGYEVIAVPLWQNGRGGGVSVDQVELEPHYGAAGVGRLSDRRIIPIFSPITIHHVILAWNWSAWKQAAASGLGNNATVINSSATLKVEAGVAIMTGIGGDQFAYEDVANVTLLGPNTAGPSTWDQNLIDRIKVHPDTPSPTGKTGITAADEAWDWELHQMIIEGDADRPGYSNQGWPIWAGETVKHSDPNPIRGSAERRIMDNDDLRALTFGMEQFIEVRGIISDSVGLKSTEAGTDDGIIVGYQGCWVYIIGKKHLL